MPRCKHGLAAVEVARLLSSILGGNNGRELGTHFIDRFLARGILGVVGR